MSKVIAAALIAGISIVAFSAGSVFAKDKDGNGDGNSGGRTEVTTTTGGDGGDGIPEEGTGTTTTILFGGRDDGSHGGGVTVVEGADGEVSRCGGSADGNGSC